MPVGTWLPAPEPARVPAEHQGSLPEQRSLAGIEGDDINMQQVFAEDPSMAALARSLAQSTAAVRSSGPWAERPAVTPAADPAATRKRFVTFSIDSADEQHAEHPRGASPGNASQPRPEQQAASPRGAAERQPSTSVSSEDMSADADAGGGDDVPAAFQRRLERELAEQLDRHRVDSAHQLQSLQMRKLGDDGGDALPPPVQLMPLQAASGLRRAPSGDTNRVYRGRVGPELRATCPMLCSAFPYGNSAYVRVCLHLVSPLITSVVDHQSHLHQLPRTGVLHISRASSCTALAELIMPTCSWLAEDIGSIARCSFTVSACDRAPVYTPLRMSSVSVAVRCEIATAFVTMSFDCAMDAEAVHDKRWPCVLFVPKAADATITDVTIVNTSQGDVYATGSLQQPAISTSEDTL